MRAEQGMPGTRAGQVGSLKPEFREWGQRKVAHQEDRTQVCGKRKFAWGLRYANPSYNYKSDKEIPPCSVDETCGDRQKINFPQAYQEISRISVEKDTKS